ncbi:hypothetical protein KL919_004085 [Ogataea angusta]|uniref:Uncharacterized protein n=1 Tax=Pichia angusta TaxID=870730 RepID=A0AAN6DDM5_PICAN|nr:uncharacterized protein KL928_004254 [Ogataea angusta]KAG7816790.1 hypothetical protein KL928_004254 [Ogataea angusta]KAG7828506.1 hypothetical protein KL920_003643 [Ogataea angusta]KAG7844407.1 hypothetical protein KL941_003783 [Ogataea angusta]KAG7856555.1 hypothetical protein KL919_004085 [Ogataea angusta]
MFRSLARKLPLARFGRRFLSSDMDEYESMIYKKLAQELEPEPEVQGTHHDQAASAGQRAAEGRDSEVARAAAENQGQKISTL